MFAHMLRLIIHNRFHLLLKYLSIRNSLSCVPSAPGEGKRRNEFAEWHVPWLAEWHNYAEFNMRSWMIQRNKLNSKERPFFWRQSICKRSSCFNVAGLTYDDNQKTTKAHCRPALKDSSCIEEKMFSKVTLRSTLIFSAKDVCTINLTVSCYVYLWIVPAESLLFVRKNRRSVFDVGVSDCINF